MTQEARVLAILKTGRWLSSVQAVGLYILRLGAVIYNLKKSGYEIEERRVQGKRYSEYRLKPLVTLPPAFDETNQNASSRQEPIV